MDNNFENGYSSSTNYGYYGEPRWDDFTLDDEIKAKKRFSRFFLSVFVYLIVANVSAILIEVLTTLILGAENALSLFSNIYYVWGVQVLCMYIIAYPAMYLIVRKMRKTVRAKSKMKISEFLVTFLIAEGLMTVGSIIANILTAFFGAFLGYQLSNDVSDLIVNTPVWLIILVAVIIGPVVEELIFRKLLMDRLGIYGDRVAIVVSAVSFGVFHGNLFQVFYAAMLGALLAYVYSKTGNVLYTIALHIMVNFFGSILPLPFLEYQEKLLEMSEQIAAGAAVDYAEYIKLTSILGGYSAIQYGLAIAGIIILVSKWKKREFFVSDRCEVLIPKQKRASVIIGNVGAILFIVLISLTFITSLLPADLLIGNSEVGDAALKLISLFKPC